MAKHPLRQPSDRSHAARLLCSLLAGVLGAFACSSQKGLKKVADGGTVAVDSAERFDSLTGTGGAPGTGGTPGTGGNTTGFCSSSSECPPPSVCNVNTDLKCGSAVYTQVDVSDENTCAVVSDGTLRCWGSNSHGQLASLSTVSQPSPIAMPGLKSVQMVATGYRFVCALDWTGQVVCWGNSNNGNLGCSAPFALGAVPQCLPYPPDSPVDKLLSGGERTCVLMLDGTAECWGRNDHYQVGNGTNVSVTSPARVLGLADATAIGTGLWQACAVLADGAARCWGENNRGQLGNGTTNIGTTLTIPIGIDGTDGMAVAVTPGEGHTCFLLDDGSVRCTGEDGYGQLGDGGTARSLVPVVSSQLPLPSRLIAVGVGFTCAVGGDQKLRCLGAGSQGQLGNGSTASSSKPVLVQLPEGVVVAAVVAKYVHACALSVDGRVFCWGANASGQLGNGTQVNSSLPVEVPPPS